MAAQPTAVTVVYRAQPGQQERTRRELAALIALAAAERGCLGIRLHEDADDGTRFLLYERWADRDSYFGEHMRTPHLQAFIQRAGEFLAGPPELTAWQQLDEARGGTGR